MELDPPLEQWHQRDVVPIHREVAHVRFRKVARQ